MITAAQALQKTKDVHLKRIEDVILAAIATGEFKCEILPTQLFISEENKNIFKDSGFTITEKETKTGNQILITWE